MNKFLSLLVFAIIILPASIGSIFCANCSAAGVPPFIVAQPAPAMVIQGNTFATAVTTGGSTNALACQWQFNGVNLSDNGRITGSLSNVLTITNAQLRDAGSYQVIVTNAYGAVTSSVAMLLLGAQPVTFNTNGAGWTTNQSGAFSTPEISNGVLTLTDGANNEARSFFCNSRQNISGFGASFTYQAGGNKSADGIAFVLQNDARGTAALGGGGGSFGVSGIAPSFELELNIFSGAANGLGYGAFISGNNGPNMLPGGVNLGSGHPISITVFYDGQGDMFLTFTDAVTGAFYNTNLNVGDLTDIVDGGTACVGFTGATGGANSIQTVSNFTFVGSLVQNAPFIPLGQSIFSTNSTWRYFKGFSEASTPDTTAWRNAGFNDSSWNAGAAPFYYEDDPGPDNPTAYTGNTDLTDMQGGYSSIFMRQTFVLTNAPQITGLQLTALSDAGFIAWINGTEVARFNVPAGNVPYNGLSSTALSEPAPVQNHPLAGPQAYLLPGTNVIAIQAFDSSPGNSSSFVIWAALSASTSAAWSNVGISEFMAANQNTVQDEDGDSSPWIELFNPTTNDVSLNGWALTDDTNNLMQWRFPNVTIPDAADANGSDNFMVVFASGKNRTSNTNELHTNFRLPANGGFLALVDPNTNIVSAFNSYPSQQTDISYGRDVINPNLAGYFPTPTPGNPNSTAGSNFSPAVEFSQTGGAFAASFQLQLSAAGTNAVIYYTLDGSVPTEDSAVYTAPIPIAGSVQVRARSFTGGLMPGSLHSESYLRLDSSVLNTTSDLPAIVIYNFGAGDVPIDDDQFVNMSIYEPQNGVTSLTNAPALTVRAGIHLHGTSTLYIPKHAFSVDFWDELDNDNNYSPLGLPAESDWVLYAPDNFEPVLIHNPLIYQLSNEIGRYAPRTRLVEVYLNTSGGPLTSANYNGIYVLEEKIKWDKNRVDINKIHSVDNLNPQDNASPNVTGGYMMRIDWLSPGETGFFAAGQTVSYDHPGEEDIKTPQRAPQQQYLQNYMNAFGAALNGANYTDPTNGYRAFVDVPSWIDHHILNVTAFNVDALRLSAYFYKDRSDVLHFGPIWDFDRSQGSTDGRDFNPRTWRSTVGDEGTDVFNYTWWGRMFTDIDFWQAWIDRYENLRTGMLSTNHIFADIDALAAQVQHEEPREIARWPSLTTPRSGSVSSDGYGYVFPGTYQGEVNFLKQWYTDRLNFMDTNFLAMPVFNNNTGAITPGFALTMTAAAGATIYYTTNNSDPRLPGGGVSPGALIYHSAIVLNTNAGILARAYDPSHHNLTGANNPPLSSPWSGLAGENFVVAAPPVITQSPANLTAYIGQSPTFTVQAGGSPAPSYQWQFNGTNLVGQTNSQLTLLSVQTSQTGAYSVIVTNLAGGTNAAFVLTVTPKPNLVITEVMSSESKGTINSTLDHLDWWELSNLGNFPVNLQGYRFDDDHDSFSDADTLTNNVTIAPGESIILAEDMTPDEFRAWWGPQNLPAGLQIITYPSIGFSASGDAVYLWNAAANSITDTVAGVTFPAATRGVSFGYNPVANVFGSLSVAGQSGAFVAAVNGDIGSPGTIINLPRFTGISFNPGSGFNLVFVTQPGLIYRVEYKNNLADPGWTTLTNFTAVSTSFSVADPVGGASSTRFYRVVVTQ